MVERLTEVERDIIKNNWNLIKETILEQKTFIQIHEKNYIINAKEIDDTIQISIKDEESCKLINILKNARFIKFKINLKEEEEEKDKKKENENKTEKENETDKVIENVIKAGKEVQKKIKELKDKGIKKKMKEDEKLLEKEELIYRSSSILFFLKYYNMKHPIYKKKEQNKSLNISVNEKNAKDIFDNPEINEIIDDNFENYVSKEEFFKFRENIIENINDYYDDEFSIQEYSELAKIISTKSKQMILKNKERNNFTSFLEDLPLINEKIIIIAGSQRIGLSCSILKILKCYNILYIDINIISSLRNVNKKKYILKRFFNLFGNYKEYKNYINNNILSLTGYDDILSIIKDIITVMAGNLEDVYIIIDNYDDHFAGNTKLSSDYIDNLYNIILEKNMKIIFIGRGLFISNMLVLYFFKKNQIRDYILFKYYSTLELGIENIIHEFYKEKEENEIDLYYKNKFVNKMEYKVFNLIIMKNIKNIIDENFREEIPFHFFRFSFEENNNLKIEYQFNDLLDTNNFKLRKYLAECNNFMLFSDKATPPLKGFLFEELVVSLLINGKTSLKNLKFEKENIIEIDSIYNMGNNITKVNNLKNGPILITQKTNGEVFDFGIIINSNNINYFIGGQIGINKTLPDLNDYIDKIEKNKTNILENLKELSGLEINEFIFLIILNKEKQDSLLEEYRKINKENKEKKGNKSTSKNDKPTKLDLYLLKVKRRLGNFNGEFGINCCLVWDLPYLLFSFTDYCFYKDNKIIDFFDVNDYHYFKTGLDSFCNKEYYLIPNIFKEDLLNPTEKKLLLNKLKEMIPELKDIKIDKKINKKISLLPGTPPNCAILSIKYDLKVITYFNETFTYFLLKDNKITKYKQTDDLFNYNFENNEHLERYFLEFIYNENHEIELDENKKTNKNVKKGKKGLIEEEKEFNEKIDDENSNKKLTLKDIKEKKGYYDNNFKYLQNKRKNTDLKYE